MSKNIIIQEGGVGKSMSVNKLRTDEVGGGSCLWVPEDETKVMHKTITEEGVYKASELDSVYGYDEVTVDLSRKIKTKRITENGVYYAEDDEILGYSEVDVNVPSDVHNTRKRITENGTYVADDEGFTGYGEVTVDVPAGRKRDKRITENGVYDPEEESLYGYGKVTVDIKKPQLKTKTIRDNGTYEAQKDDGVYGYSRVNVNVPLPKLKSRRITENGTYIANQEDREYEDAPSDVYGYSQVVVDVPQQGQVRTKTIRENGTYTAANEDLLGYSVVNVNVPGGKLGTKSITENGTYTAADDNLYGFRSVSVRVAGSQGSADNQGRPTTSGGITPGGTGSSVIGVNTGGVQWPSADDQNEYAVGVNESGNLVVTPVPSGIEIVTEPTKKTYTAGETIDYTGIVVKLKSKDGGDFTNSDYSNGKIPMNELIFTVNTASGSVNPDPDGQIHTGSYYVSDGSAVAACTQPDGTGGNIVAPAGVTFCGIKKINDSGFYVVAIGDSPFTFYCYRQNDGRLETEITANLVNFDGVSKYVAFFYWHIPAPTPIIAYNQPSPTDTRSIQFIAYDIMYGDGSPQVIPVGWKSPYDDRQFVDGFNITVMRSSSGNGSGTESGGSNTGGSGGNDDDFSGSGGSF